VVLRIGESFLVLALAFTFSKFSFKQKPKPRTKKMNMTCKLCAKCLKLDETLEKCQDPDCDNMIHPRCGKKIMETFEEGEWEGPLFCSKKCFNWEGPLFCSKKCFKQLAKV